MESYLKTVTLGAFTWKNEERIALFMDYIRRMGAVWLLLHFLLLTFCLNFPVMFQIARLNPYEFYSRLYSGNTAPGTPLPTPDTQLPAPNSAEEINEFNAQMTDNNFGRSVMLPILGFSFGLTLIIQIVFYFSAVFFLGLSRMNAAPLSFRERTGLCLFSSTLPVLAAALFGLFLPTVHIIIYYFIIIFVIFHRSKLCPNG